MCITQMKLIFNSILILLLLIVQLIQDNNSRNNDNILNNNANTDASVGNSNLIHPYQAAMTG